MAYNQGSRAPFDSEASTAWSTPRSNSPPPPMQSPYDMELQIGVARTHDRTVSEDTASTEYKDGTLGLPPDFGASSNHPHHPQTTHTIPIGSTRRHARILSSVFGGYKDGEGTRSPMHTASSTSLDDGLDNDSRQFNRVLEDIARKHPRLGRALLYARGPSPPVNESSIRPFLPKIEGFFARIFRPLTSWRRVITPLFLAAWLVGFAFFVRASFYTSSTNVGNPTWIVADTSYWYRDDQCGINGTSCMPFTDYSFVFRCPGQTLAVELLNARAVGSKELIYQPLIVGGMDDLGTYRADSWICGSAIHHGLFSNQRGGCGQLELVGEFTNYEGGNRNGVSSVGFGSTFPSSYRFVDTVDQGGCMDMRDDILPFNVVMSTIFSFVIRPASQAFFWTLLCLGYWHVVLVSDPSAMPPDIETGFAYFLPTLFVGKVFWRHSFRWVLPAYEGAVIERTIWYLGGFWVGTLINVSLAWIPIDRLTAHDIQQQPGGLVAVIVLVVLLFLAVVNQLRVIRKTGWFFFYLKWYAIGGAVLGVLAALPGFQFRLHHYIASILLLPGCAFVTRPSALFQGFLLGMFCDGVGRWGYDAILQTAASLVGDGSLGSDLPTWVTNSTNFTMDQSSIWWNSIPTSLASEWDGYALIVDDVLAYTGNATSWNTTTLDLALPHYFRLAYQLSGTSGDFTKAATAYFTNGTWLDAASGSG